MDIQKLQSTNKQVNELNTVNDTLTSRIVALEISSTAISTDNANLNQKMSQLDENICEMMKSLEKLRNKLCDTTRDDERSSRNQTHPEINCDVLLIFDSNGDFIDPNKLNKAVVTQKLRMVSLDTIIKDLP